MLCSSTETRSLRDVSTAFPCMHTVNGARNSSVVIKPALSHLPISIMLGFPLCSENGRSADRSGDAAHCSRGRGDASALQPRQRPLTSVVNLLAAPYRYRENKFPTTISYAASIVRIIPRAKSDTSSSVFRARSKESGGRAPACGAPPRSPCDERRGPPRRRFRESPPRSHDGSTSR